MDSLDRLIDAATGSDSAFAHHLDRPQLERRTPAALAAFPDPRTSSTYAFLSSERVIQALAEAGFLPVAAAQAHTRRSTNPLSARHVIRFRRRLEIVTLRDCVPEIQFLNAHDGRTATQFRLALFRPVCTNGLIVCDETLPAWRVPHRGHTLEDIVAAALQLSEQFASVGTWVERMERTQLDPAQRLLLASDAITLRFPKKHPTGLEPAHLLIPRRGTDSAHDLWTTYNVIQEHIIKGGLRYQTGLNQPRRSRGIRSIREDVRLNTALWRMATTLVVD